MSNDKSTLERLKSELAELRASLEHMRVQASLGRSEARDRLDALERRLDPAFQKAKRALDEILASGTAEARTLSRSLLAGWEELRRTHRELSREAEDGRSSPKRPSS